MNVRFLSLILAVATAWSGTLADSLDDCLKTAQARNEGFDLYSVESTFGNHAADPIEGVWHVTTDDEGVFSIIRDPHSSRYIILVTNSADRTISPGSVMGVAASTARKGVYDARIYTSSNSGKLSKPKRFTLTLSPEGLLSFRPVNKGLRINIWRLLPYMFRRAVRTVDDRDPALDGAVRIYPKPTVAADGPVYL